MALTPKSVGEFLKRYPIGVVGVLLSAIALAGYIVRSSRVSELSAQFNNVDEHAQKIAAEVRNASNLGEQYTAITGATKEMESRLIRRAERARNQGYFYQLEMESGVKELGLVPANAGPRKDASRLFEGIEFTITVQGEYRQILDFVGRLESGQHFYRLMSASISRMTGGEPSAPGSSLCLTITVQLLGLP
jgi:hypothetical protein